MVLVPSGTFTMGSVAGGYDQKGELPAHQVTLTGYWIYKNDITVAQYRTFCAATARALPIFPSRKSWEGKTGWDDPALQQHPIVNVSWHDAKAYADWAGVTLPTEAQWEYAARGPQGLNYPWGGTATNKDDLIKGWDATKCANIFNSYEMGKSTWPVGSFPAGASWCGAQDMVGNVWQWCSDWYGEYSAMSFMNPIGPATGTYRVLRGGSWSWDGSFCRNAYRNNGNPDNNNTAINGFRCVSIIPDLVPRLTDAIPSIAAITPASASVGAEVIITGTDMNKVTAVTFNGISAKFTKDGTTTLKVTVPEGATFGKLELFSARATVTSANNFVILYGMKNNIKDNAEIVWVPGGTFTMGSPAGVGRDAEHPAHQVTLSGYWIYKYDVTVAQYLAYCEATGSQIPNWPGFVYSWSGKKGWGDPALQQHPIVNVSWHDAKGYATWAGVMLPTEAQWEYAARGPKGHNYPWGGTATARDPQNGWDKTKCTIDDFSTVEGKSTMPVGSFPAGASWCGAQDMAGSVWQWCDDRYGPYTAAAVTDPTGAPDTSVYRVQRGGSWRKQNGFDFIADYDRSVYRGSNSPIYHDYFFGFRCASVAPGPSIVGIPNWSTMPTIITVTPPSGVVGTMITISATNLDKVTTVNFNGVDAKTITDNTATSLKVTVPEGATPGKLIVTAAGGTITNAYDFIVLFGHKANPTDKSDMVWVPGATFTMGSAADIGEDNEHPAHQVTLSSYWIYEYDVTVAQYRAFCMATERKMPAWPGDDWSWKGISGWDDLKMQQRPIINITWDDAKAYADWAGVVLPTEAQWEYAARGLQGHNYPWGGRAIKKDSYNGWDVTKCANMENSFNVFKSTWPVGSFPAGASWCGAQDMAGNVWQWCSDWYGDYAKSAVTDPTGPTNGVERVLRGGSWINSWNVGNRGAYRRRTYPDIKENNYGFRCVSTAPGP